MAASTGPGHVGQGLQRRKAYGTRYPCASLRSLGYVHPFVRRRVCSAAAPSVLPFRRAWAALEDLACVGASWASSVGRPGRRAPPVARCVRPSSPPPLRLTVAALTDAIQTCGRVAPHPRCAVRPGFLSGVVSPVLASFPRLSRPGRPRPVFRPALSPAGRDASAIPSLRPLGYRISGQRCWFSVSVLAMTRFAYPGPPVCLARCTVASSLLPQRSNKSPTVRRSRSALSPEVLLAFTWRWRSFALNASSIYPVLLTLFTVENVLAKCG